jgi:hypothetical protein
VVRTLEVKPASTARELYKEIKSVNPNITRIYEFKSFVKIINFFPDVKPTNSLPKKYEVFK